MKQRIQPGKSRGNAAYRVNLQSFWIKIDSPIPNSDPIATKTERKKKKFTIYKPIQEKSRELST